jgi:predicted dinucleotide-binding enzyme
MNVTIIGAGNMGRGIGHRLVAGGHDRHESSLSSSSFFS